MKLGVTTVQLSNKEADTVLYALLRGLARLNTDLVAGYADIDPKFLDAARTMGAALDIWGDYCIEATFYDEPTPEPPAPRGTRDEAPVSTP